MSDDFKEKLELYKAGKLSTSEAAAIEEDIEKYMAIKDYLQDIGGEFVEELKQELDSSIPAENLIKKKITKKISTRMIGISLATILTCLVLLPVLYITTMTVAGKVFRVDSTRFGQEENFTGQFLQMVFPQASYTGGRNHTEFYKQMFACNYKTGISRKSPYNTIEIYYAFGKLQKTKNTAGKPLEVFPSDSFYALHPETYFNTGEWSDLEKAPEGTKAQIIVAFKSRLTPQQAIAALGKQYFDAEKDFTIRMLADTGSQITVGNPYIPAGYYSQSPNSASKNSELEFINKFNAYDNDVHKQMLLFGLGQIKKHRNIADVITLEYSVQREALFDDIDKQISYVDKNGVQYVGAVISGDTKELLQLKDNPIIYACRVEDIVVW